MVLIDDATMMTEWWFSVESSSEILSIVVHSLFSFIAVAIVLVTCIRRNQSNCIFMRFFGHGFLWILTASIIVILILEVLEGILFSVKISSFHLSIHLSNVTAVLAAILVLVLYNFAENQCSAGYLFLILSYWFVCAAVSTAKLIAVTRGNSLITKDNAKFFLTCLVLCHQVLLVFLCAIVLVKQEFCQSGGRVSSSRRADTSEEDDLTSVKFIHSYVCLLSKVLLHWFNGILLTGYRKCVTLADLGRIPTTDGSQVNFQKLKTLLEEEKNLSYDGNRSLSLFSCFWKMTKPMMMLSGFFKISSDLLLYIPPLCIDVIVSYLMKQNLREDPSDDRWTRDINNTLINNHSTPLPSRLKIHEFFTNGYVVSIICFFILILQMTLFQHHLFIAIRQGIRCKCALQALVFDKSLRLYASSINEGKLMNHMTVDPLHVVMLFTFAHSIWTMPFQILVGLVMLYLQLGTSALISAFLILLMVIVQYLVGKRLGLTQKKIMEQADERLKQSNEMLQSIKLLKLYAWEHIFFESVVSTRAKELRLMLTASLLRVVSITVTDGVPYVACLLTFTLYHYLESEPLHPGKVFSGLALFAIFSGQLFVITLMINVSSQAKASVTRLRDFLLLPEVVVQSLPHQAEMTKYLSSYDDTYHEGSGQDTVSYPLQKMSLPRTPSGNGFSTTQALDKSLVLRDFVIEIQDGNFGFNEKQILFGIGIKIPAGKLTMVTGPVGSGKSCLLWSMLGEMKKLSGSIINRGFSYAFVAQKSWIMNSTVRQNILFGLPFDATRYQSVIEAAGLQPDLLTFIAGDQTEIGEKGANLSGGQRQRVSIARALYSDADVYLMDDPLSALDAQVGGHIFEEAILKLLISNGKTVVLVTHHVHFLPYADHLIVMRNGRVFYEGIVNGLVSQSSLLTISQENRMLSRDSLVKLEGYELTLHNKLTPSFTVGIKSALSFTTLSILSDEANYDEVCDKSKDNSFLHKDMVPEPEIGRLIEEEEVSFGAVSCQYFVSYFRAATWLLTILAVSFYSLRLAIRMTSDFWLTKMIDLSILTKLSNHSDDDNPTDNGNLSISNDHSMPGVDYEITIYCILSVIAVLLVPFGTLFLEFMALTASRTLHHRLLQQVISAPLRFFDTNPIGRIVNRLSADMNVIDEKLTVIFDAFLYCVLAVIGGVIINCAFVPYFLLPVAPIVILFIFIQRFCIYSCRELQRLDCSTKSPILAHFSQMLAGLSTIRANRCEERFQLENFKKIDSNNVVFLFFNTCHLWLGLRLDYLGSLLVLTASLSAVTTCLLGAIDPSTVGLVISYAVMICSLMNWTMRNLSELEVYFGSVERILQYSAIQSEPYEISQGPVPPLEWPSEGEIKFESVSLQYSPELDPVVHNFSLHIKPGTKVGICGRTGSGKSSLTLSLFRMVNISSGRILLDGIDICAVPLRLLRSKLSIIPQEPVLFSGTVRFNLDPQEKKSNEEIWRVLEIAQLKDLVSGLPKQLDTSVTEGGHNFSIGQQQLFCLARALLCDSKVLVMDEATASIDAETDLLIQKIVKQAFEYCTVFTIAHRLSTIRNCDVVVVLKDGCKIEEGDPTELIAANGAFARMLTENQL